MSFLRAVAALAVGISTMTGAWGYMLPQQSPTDTLILVNKEHRALSYPIVLVKPDVPPTKEVFAENIYMRPEAAQALESLFRAAKSEGITLYATSGYRSYATQKAIYERKLKQLGGNEKRANASVAKPGYSEHQTGLAMDVEGETTREQIGLDEAFGDSPEGRWLAENCWQYGFILRYPKDKTNITGYVYEPWHIRYVGVETALNIQALDITFEEYIFLLRSERREILAKGESGS